MYKHKNIEATVLSFIVRVKIIIVYVLLGNPEKYLMFWLFFSNKRVICMFVSEASNIIQPTNTLRCISHLQRTTTGKGCHPFTSALFFHIDKTIFQAFVAITTF